MQVIDPIAPRHTGIATAGKVPLSLSNGPSSIETATVPKHKKNPDVGTKTLNKGSKLWVEQVDAAAVSEGEEVCLSACAFLAARSR